MLLQRYEKHGEAFLRIIVTEDELVLPLHHREQGCLDDLKASSLSSQKKFKIVQSPGKVMTDVFWGAYALAHADVTVR